MAATLVKNDADDIPDPFEVVERKAAVEVDATEADDEMMDDSEAESPKKPKKTRKTKKNYKEKIMCPECNKIISKCHLKRHHEISHQKIKNHSCDVCGRKFYYKNRLRDHLKLHLELKDVECDLCHMKFTSKNTLLTHKNIYHYRKYVIKCERCGDSFNNRDLYNTHFRKKHTGEKPFVCDLAGCGKAFYSKIALYCHKTQVHREVEQCEICGKSAKHMKSHMKSHTGYQFECKLELGDGSVCGKKFISNSRLKQHENIHNGIKNFVCRYCSMAYTRSGTLNNHIRSYHLRFKLKCDFPECTAAYARKKNLNNHVLKKHKNVGEEQIQAALERIKRMPLPSTKEEESVDMDCDPQAGPSTAEP